MKKEKIAISVDPATLEMVDAMTDGLSIRSRSQAIEYLINKGIEQQYVKEAVMLIRGQEANLLLQEVEGKPLIDHHLDWLNEHGIETVYLVTGQSLHRQEIESHTKNRLPVTKIILENQPTGTMAALKLLDGKLHGNFVVLFGDTLNKFNLTKMILFHLKNEKIATIGLISSDEPTKYSTVELEGDRIVEFRREDSRSHIIDAGIYIFKPLIFKHFTNGKFFERDVFPTLCHTDEIKGYFTHGTYVHLGG